MECKFCNIVKKNILLNDEIKLTRTPIYNTIICETESFLVMPDLGSIIEGYLLIITKKHLNSMAELDMEQLHELDILINILSKLAKKIYGTEPVLFEHGSPPSEVVVNAQSSICHAHMHLVPMKFVNSDKIRKEAGMYLFNGISCLNEFRGTSYVYYKTQKKKDYITVNQNLPRQYMRRKLAIEANISEKWNWREYPFMGNIEKTICSYQKILKVQNFSNYLCLNDIEKEENLI